MKEANHILELKKTKDEKAKLLCELVREIPYCITNSFDPQDMIRYGKGSCTPKHLLLADYLNGIGIPVKLLVVSHHFRKSQIPFPSSMEKIVNAMPLTYHTALRAEIYGKDIFIDVTFDSKLHGFPLNDDWDGRCDMKYAVFPEEVTETDLSTDTFSHSVMSRYTETELKTVKLFVRSFNEFCERVRVYLC